MSILENGGIEKLVLPLEGLEIMNDDPYMTDVVYAKVNDVDGILQRKKLLTPFFRSGKFGQ